MIFALRHYHLKPSIETPEHCQPIASLQWFSKAASIVVFLIGLAVIWGWQFDIALFKSVLPGLVTMKVNTAICFMLSGVAIWFLHRQPVKDLSRKRNRTSKINRPLFLLNRYLNHPATGLAIAITSLGLLTLIQYSFDLDFGIDQFLFSDDPNPIDTYAPGRMGFNTALNFFLLGLAILLLTKKRYYLAQSLSLMVFLIAYLGLLGYFYGIKFFYGIGCHTAMALHTSINFILLSISLLFYSANQGLMKIAIGNLAGGIMVRRLSIPVMVIPPFLGWVILSGKRLNLYDGEVGIALLCILNILLLIALIWWNGRTLGEIDYQALHDIMTGLPNRINFNRQLSVALANSRYRQETLAVMFLDLDRFKKINDTLGHAVGDRILQAVARRLTDCLPDTVPIARWGGDEFTLLLPNIHNTHYVSELAQKIIDALKPPFSIDNHYLHITSSIGIAVYPYDGEDAETLIKNADVSLYSVKVKGRNNYQFYNPNINEQSSELLFLENRLYHAWERGEFQVFYQPKISIMTGKITGMEALVRWYSPEFGLVSPVKFIPIAEENGLILPIGEWVLRTACAQCKAWIEAGFSPIGMAVNISARQLQQPNLVEIVTGILTETGLPAKLLELEITETTAMQNVEFTRKILTQLNQMGVQIAIDDFGTGYSSLNYLKNFPIRAIKIDRCFVRDLTVDPSDMAIASAIVALGRGLNMNVVAEGVETKEQLECLRKLECQEMQGYFFSQPLSSQDASALLSNYQCPIAKRNRS